MNEVFLAPFAYAFMQRAALAMLLAGLGCAWVGVHITARRMSFLGDALAHATLPGVVLVVVLGWPLLVGALFAALTTALGVWWVGRLRALHEDSAIGVIYTTLFAIGVIGLHAVGSPRDLTHVLLGNPLGVQSFDLLLITAVVAVVVFVLLVSHRLLVATLLDGVYADGVGWSRDRARAILLMTTAMMVVVALSVVGVVLTVALMITPAACVRPWCRRMRSMILAAMAVGMAATIGGLLCSWHLSWPTGATVVTVLGVMFLISRVAAQVVGPARRLPLSRPEVAQQEDPGEKTADVGPIGDG